MMFVLATGSFLMLGSAETLDGISLLQKHAQVRTPNLEEPKLQSAMTTDAELSMGDVDFQCKGGKGKWYQTSTLVGYGEAPLMRGPIRVIGKWIDTGTDYKTGEKTECERAVKDTNGTTQLIKMGDVTDEVDCYNRAIQDVHSHSNLEYMRCGWRQQLKNYGVIYNPYGTHGQAVGGVRGACFVAGFGNPFEGKDLMGKVVIEKAPPAETVEWGKGLWFCQLEDSDVKLSKILKKSKDDKEPKEKKTKEEREQCKASKGAKKEKKAAWKALRAEVKEARAALKALKARLKAARQEYDDASDAVDGDC